MVAPNRRPDRNCDYCGKSYWRPSCVKKPGRFCSTGCQHKSREKPIEERFWARVDKGQGANDCWMWTGAMAGNYGAIKVRGATTTYVHRLSYTLHFGAIPAGMFVCHTCDVPKCVNPDHLFLGTAKDNTQDMVRKGRVSRGEALPQSKLTASQVIEIRRAYDAGEARISDLAKQYGIWYGPMAHIVHRTHWTHI